MAEERGRLTLNEMVRLIAKARKLDPPRRAPRPGKRFKLGKGFYVSCRVSENEGVESAKQPRYLLTKRIEGVRHPICLTHDWDTFLEHMGWKKTDDSTT